MFQEGQWTFCDAEESRLFGVANAQKQGVIRARLALESSTTMFQERAPFRRAEKDYFTFNFVNHQLDTHSEV